MNEIIFLVEDTPEGGFSARALGHSIFTVGETEQELQAMVEDASACHFDDGEAPKIVTSFVNPARGSAVSPVHSA
ncbi:MAG: 2-oxoisovalerate dehydrogenase [Acidobacteriota bacterium]